MLVLQIINKLTGLPVIKLYTDRKSFKNFLGRKLLKLIYTYVLLDSNLKKKESSEEIS